MSGKTQTKLDRAVPVLWLLGKTGAGKTSLVRALTGQGEIGDGFRPRTQGTNIHDFPAQAPAVRFLDTRGLAEAGHDPGDDIAAARAAAQAVLVVIRLDDLDIAPLGAALKGLSLPVMAVLTGADLIPDATERAAAQDQALARLRAMLGTVSPHVTLSMPRDGMMQGLESLLEALDSFMPQAVRALRRADEARVYAKLRPVVMRYAAMASGSDVVPLVGAAAVPAAQVALLYALARHHGVTLTSARLGVLASALGVGTLTRLGVTHLARQGAKLVPGVGQTLGAAAAAGASFATTVALGRAASAWLYGLARGTEPDPASLRALYDQALRTSASADR